MTTALMTDHYELTMVSAAMASGTANRRSVFELFGRRLPSGRRYGVVAGVGRMLEQLEQFRFDDSSIAFLRENQIADERLADWLSNYRFTGSMWGYPEGEVYFPGSPLLVVEGTFAEACILETLLLSIYNHDSAIASAASRMTWMAEDRPCVEMGSRRTHEEAAIAAARAAYLAGFSATSNLAAGQRWGVPTLGTAAHSFTLLHDTESDAFQAQLDTLGLGTTLLVDTYDIRAAVSEAVRLTDGKLGAVRIDSGDLAVVARQVREQLDDLGATTTRIIVTSDLDEWQIAALSGSPVDGYGVGTSVVTGSGHPTSGFVYKLVARADDHNPDSPLMPVAKKSRNKGSIGGRKYAVRRINEDGVAEAELVGVSAEPRGDQNDRSLLVPILDNGERVYSETLAEVRQRHQISRAELPSGARRLSHGEPVLPTIMLDDHGEEAPNPYAQSD